MQPVIDPTVKYRLRVVRRDTIGLFVHWQHSHYYAPEGTQTHAAMLVSIDPGKVTDDAMEVTQSAWQHRERWIMRT